MFHFCYNLEKDFYVLGANELHRQTIAFQPLKYM